MKIYTNQLALNIGRIIEEKRWNSQMCQFDSIRMMQMIMINKNIQGDRAKFVSFLRKTNSISKPKINLLKNIKRQFTQKSTFSIYNGLDPTPESGTCGNCGVSKLSLLNPVDQLALDVTGVRLVSFSTTPHT